MNADERRWASHVMSSPGLTRRSRPTCDGLCRSEMDARVKPGHDRKGDRSSGFSFAYDLKKARA